MDPSAKTAHSGLDAKAAGGASAGGARPYANSDVVKSATAEPPHILVVEDQEDVRRMVATALEIEGYRVTEAANAIEGLNELRRRNYQLVLSDYAMPGGTGTWMIQEAERHGLMGHTIALIVTAHPDVRELADVAVINKPLDLDYFLDQVRKLVGSPRGVSAPALTPAPAAPQKVELVLYISPTSAASIQARQNLDRLLLGFDDTHVTCTVVDLLQNPLAGEDDRIAFTPTLVKRSPGPRTWILGNLRNGDILADLLVASGVARIDVAR